MTQEEKDLLLKDLCGRLPYGVMVSILSWDPREMDYYDGVDTLYSINGDGYIKTTNEEYEFNAEEIKPYLFPLSSMTEEQLEEFEKCGLEGYHDYDWYNKHHFDYRGLIPLGLAEDATGKNIY